jgi:hypothetical protein
LTSLCVPLGFLVFAVVKCRALCSEGNLEYGAFPHRSVRTIYNDAMEIHGTGNKIMTLLVDLHDIRYRGDWAKKSADAKMWGFFLANTAGLWFCFAIPLVKKLFTAVAVNIPFPAWSAGFMCFIYWVDAVSGVCLRGHRDHFVNYSGVYLFAPLNACGVNGEACTLVLGSTAATGVLCCIDLEV